MKHRAFAKYVTEEEVQIMLKIIDPWYVLLRIEREIKSNFIVVYFREEDNDVEKRLDFLPDCIYAGEDYFDRPNTQYEYFQFTMAKGYSEYWKDNPYIESEIEK